MKVWAIFLFLFSLQSVLAQVTIPVSSTGIGDIKINMTLQQVEKATGQVITLKTASIESYEMDTALVKYKGVPVTIIWYTVGGDETEKPQKKVYSVGASHPGLQTRSGFTLGSDKFDIVKKLDGMYLNLQPDWRMDSQPDKAKYSVLMLTDGENGTQLIMYFENNKLSGFQITIHEGC
jgi:hypothetical protein